jgi:hypothetical protein
MKKVLETRSKEFSLYLHNFRNLKSPFCALSAARMTPIIFPEEEEEFLKREREWEHVMPSGYVRLLRLDIDTHTTREEKKKKKKVNFPFSWLEEQMKLSSLTGFTQRHTKRDGQIRSKRRK